MNEVIDYVDLIQTFPPKTEETMLKLGQASSSLKAQCEALGLTVPMVKSYYMPPRERKMHCFLHAKELSNLPRKLKKRYKKNNWDWFRRHEPNAPHQLPYYSACEEVADVWEGMLKYARQNMQEKFMKPVFDAFADHNGLKRGELLQLTGVYGGGRPQMLLTCKMSYDEVLSRVTANSNPTIVQVSHEHELAPEETVNNITEGELT